MRENPNLSPARETQTIDPDRKLILPQQFDNVTKRRVRQDPAGFVMNLLGIQSAEAFEVIETEQLSMKTHFADSFILVTIHGKKIIVHCEFQTHDSRDVPMPIRMAGYIGSGIEFYKLPIYSHVIYLHPNAGHSDPGEYVQEIPGYNIHIQYRVLRLCEMDGQTLLDTNRIGLIPFAGLMKPPAQVDPLQWMRHCVQAVEAESHDEIQKVETLTDLAILSGLTYNFQTIHDIISEETVLESSVVQHFIEKGIEQGVAQGKREALLQHVSSDSRRSFDPPSCFSSVKRIESTSTFRKSCYFAGR